MPGPWEHYQRTEPAEESGPWQRYVQKPVESKPIAATHPVERFAEGAWKNIDPVAAVESAAQITASPLESLKAIGQAQGERLTAAQKAWESGDYMSAARHALEYAIPIFGPVTGSAGDKMAGGDIAGGLGETAGAAVSLFGPKAVGSAATAVKGAAASAASNPTVRAAAKAVAKHTPVVGRVMRAEETINDLREVVDTLRPKGKTSAMAELAEETASSPILERPFGVITPKREPVSHAQEPAGSPRVPLEETFSDPAMREQVRLAQEKMMARKRAMVERDAVPARTEKTVGEMRASDAEERALQKKPAATERPAVTERPASQPEVLAARLDEAVDSTTRERLAAKLTPEQMAQAEEMAAAMGQRPSLGKGVVDDAKVGAEIEGTNRAAQAQKMAEKLKETGITSDMAARMNADQWRQVQYAAGADPKSATTHLEKPPSARTQAEALEVLRKMENPAGTDMGRASVSEIKKLERESVASSKAAAARAVKVQKLADWLRSNGVTAEGASGLDWEVVSKEAGTINPSADTISAVIEKLSKNRVSGARAEAEAMDAARKAKTARAVEVNPIPSADRFYEISKEISSIEKSPIYRQDTHEGALARDRVIDLQRDADFHKPAAVSAAEADIAKESLRSRPAQKSTPASTQKSIEEIATGLYKSGVVRQEAWSRFVIARGLKPEIDAKVFYQYFDAAAKTK